MFCIYTKLPKGNFVIVLGMHALSLWKLQIACTKKQHDSQQKVSTRGAHSDANASVSNGKFCIIGITCITHAWTMQSMPWPHAELFKVLLQFFMRCEAHGIDANGAGVSKVHRKIMECRKLFSYHVKGTWNETWVFYFHDCDANGTGLSKVRVQVRIFQSWLVLL